VLQADRVRAEQAERDVTVSSLRQPPPLAPLPRVRLLERLRGACGLGSPLRPGCCPGSVTQLKDAKQAKEKLPGHSNKM